MPSPTWDIRSYRVSIVSTGGWARDDDEVVVVVVVVVQVLLIGEAEDAKDMVRLDRCRPTNKQHFQS